MLKRALAFAALLLCVPALARADCSGLPGQRMTLLSNNYDPDVLLWDSKQRLLDYAAGDWSVDKILLPHALLARAGTRVLVISCQINVVHPKYQLAPADAVGVKVINGPYKGRFGWVMAGDMRVLVPRSARGR